MVMVLENAVKLFTNARRGDWFAPGKWSTRLAQLTAQLASP